MKERRLVVALSIPAALLTVLLAEGFYRNFFGANGGPNTGGLSISAWRLPTHPGADDPSAPDNVSVLTYHNDVARTGQNLQEKILTPSSVNSGSFGKVDFLAVDGLVDAEPLYVPNVTIGGRPHNVVFAVTEHDSVYAFDADTFTQLWHVRVLGPDEMASDDRSCAQVSPEIGITATPVITFKKGRGSMYLVAMAKDNDGNYFQRLHALDITTGAESNGSPVTIEAKFPNLKGETTFDPKQYKERAALLLLNGVIYTTWASHCDNGDYTGWVIGYSAGTLQRASVLNLTPNGREGAVWMSGAGPAADSANNIYLLDGNGTFDNVLNPSGFPVDGDFGNAFLKLSANGGTLSVPDYFNMQDTLHESDRDEDLGSGGALVLPDFKDASGNIRQLAVGAGKDGCIYVVNRNSMGKFSTINNNAIYQAIDHALRGGIWSMPAYFKNTVYFGAAGDSLKAFAVADAKLVPVPASMTSTTFAYPGTTPSISANDDLDGIVWAVENRRQSAGILHAYDASDLAIELYNSKQAGDRDAFTDNKYITPMIANGKVFVGTPNGVVVFGLLSK